MKSALRDPNWSTSGWALAVGSVLVLLLGVALPPFVAAGVGDVVRAGYSTLCHQLPERSFGIGGMPFAVCHRCTGIFLGLTLGALVFPLARSSALTWARFDPWLLLLALVPVVIDWGGEALGWWTNTVVSRTVTGTWFGLVAGFIYTRALSFRRGAESAGRSVMRDG